MVGVVWEVVGGSEKGGIVVREDQSVKSKELAERLSTGALVKEVKLVGDRLNYVKLTGTGPNSGWVSIKVGGKDLLVKSGKEVPDAPVVVCFYGGGYTAEQGAKHLEPLLHKIEGEPSLGKCVVLDHAGEPGYEDCEGWEDYINRLAAKVDSQADHRDRSVLIFAHSHGCLPAYGLAKRLGSRCLKLYVACRRPPDVAVLDDAWGVSCGEELLALDDASLIRKMLETWPNRWLENSFNPDKLSPGMKQLASIVRRQYSSPAAPCGSLDAAEAFSGDSRRIAAPILAFSAGQETSRGETAAKMDGWRHFTSSDFKSQALDTTHMDIMEGKLYKLVLADMEITVSDWRSSKELR